MPAVSQMQALCLFAISQADVSHEGLGRDNENSENVFWGESCSTRHRYHNYIALVIQIFLTFKLDS